MKHILSIGFAQENQEFENVVNFFGQEYRISHYSSNFDIHLTAQLIKKFDGRCDVICISGLPPKYKFKKGFFLHPDVIKLRSTAKHTPIVDGHIIKDVYIPYAIRMFYLKNKNFLTKRRIGFYSAALQKPFVEVLEELGNDLVMADPYFLLKLPFNLHNSKTLNTFIKTIAPVLKRLKISKSSVPSFSDETRSINRALDEFLSCDIFVGNEANINFLNLDHLKGKTLIIDVVSAKFEEKLKASGLSEALICLPQLSIHPKINYAVLEGIIQLKNGVGNPVKDDDVITLMEEIKLLPELRKFNDDLDNPTIFSFVIHPLSVNYLFKHPLLRFMNGEKTKFIHSGIEEIMSLSPGFYYGKIDGIVSQKNGKR